MARGITMTASAPMPWTKRSPISHSMVGASRQPIEPRMNRPSPKERRLAPPCRRPGRRSAGRCRRRRRRPSASSAPPTWRRGRPRWSASPAGTCRSRRDRSSQQAEHDGVAGVAGRHLMQPCQRRNGALEQLPARPARRNGGDQPQSHDLRSMKRPEPARNVRYRSPAQRAWSGPIQGKASTFRIRPPPRGPFVPPSARRRSPWRAPPRAAPVSARRSVRAMGASRSCRRPSPSRSASRDRRRPR